MSIKELWNIIKKIYKSKQYIIVTSDSLDNPVPDIEYSKEMVLDWEATVATSITNHNIQSIGEREYGMNLEKYNPDLYNAYKEADYQIAKVSYLQAELEYYKLVNNPNGGDANTTYNMYNRLQMLKNRYENFK